MNGSEKMTYDSELPFTRMNEDAEEAEEHMAQVNEYLCADHSLPEIEGLPHLCHKVNEQGRTTLRVDCLHKSNDLTLKRDSF